MHIEKEIKNLHELFLLKEIERMGRVKNRRESSAEHTWSAMVLAQYFLPKVSHFLDEKKVMRMLLYHDLIEIESGDTFIFNDFLLKYQHSKEHRALRKLASRIPKAISSDFVALWNEFEDDKTPEAQFCQAMDKLDPIIQSAFKKEDWTFANITEKKLREKKEKYFKPFPPIARFFEEFIRFAKRKKYFE